MLKTFVLLCLLTLIGSGCSSGVAELPPRDSARSALDRGDLVTARRLAESTPAEDPGWAEAQMILGAVAHRSGDLAAAQRCYRAVPRDGSPLAMAAAIAEGDIAVAQGQLHIATQLYAGVLQRDAGHRDARKALARLLAATGQRRLADGHLFELVKVQDLDFKLLILFTDIDRRDPTNLIWLQKCERPAPDDPAVNLGLADEELAKGHVTSARRRLESVLKSAPELAAAQALMGELLIDEDADAVLHWHERLPSCVHDAAEIWYVRGLWARRQGHADVGVRCLWEAARQMPTSHRVLHQLALAVTAVDPQQGQLFARHAQELYDLRQFFSQALNSQGRNANALREVITRLLDSGREWEARAWAGVAMELHPTASWLRKLQNRLDHELPRDAPRIHDAANMLVQHDLSHYPTYEKLFPAPSSHPALRQQATQRAAIRFADRAAELGVQFTYHHGRVAGQVGVRMQESTGGGVGILDYDGDGCPDLFLTQGEDWPQNSDTPAPADRHQDQLYRNLGTRFQNVTAETRIPLEGGFGQGCAAGDFNNDGFTDLYIANIGRNQLLLNNGDGTFDDASASSQFSGNTWTSSCVIADFNADGFPDLFDSNYVEGESLYRKICDEHNCSPQAYRHARDELYLSNGDGTLRRFELGGEERWGAGLGVVAFRLDATPAGRLAVRQAAADAVAPPPGPGRLCLFVANDHEPNFFLINAPADNADNLSLIDYAFVRGLAVNKDGRPMACMGVASGDLNGDSELDLFVTNYKDEPNNLYVQSPGGFFTDAIAGSGLMAPGVPYVGWGTQALDADNDGRLDLIVANGHVGDFQKPGLECDMPTQFFRQHDRGRFVELSPDTVGPYFGHKLLGRTMATLDWNHDGRVDCVHSPIADPVAILTNETDGGGHTFAVRLHATTTARDAIGAIVTITTSTGESHQQLTAGDGYQATNERVLRFGLGPEPTISRVTIEWPGGATQSFTEIAADTLLEVAEGIPQATVWRNGESIGTVPR